MIQNVEVISESWIWAELVGRNFNDLTVVGCANTKIGKKAAVARKVFFNLLMAKYFVMEEYCHLHLYRTAVNFN